MSQLAASALIFLRGDVRPAQRTVGRSYSREQVIESLRLPRSEQPYFTPGFPLALPLTHAVRITSFGGPPTGQSEPVTTADSIESDTRELVWRSSGKGTGLVVVDTPSSQALVGHVAKQGGKTKNLRADLQTPFCAVTLGALDNKPVSSSTKLLLTVTARVANTDMEWNAKRNSLEKWGKAPVRIEPVTGKVVLTGLAKVREVVAQPLDGSAQPLGQPVALSRDGDGWALDLGKPPTTWFVITVRR